MSDEAGILYGADNLLGGGRGGAHVCVRALEHLSDAIDKDPRSPHHALQFRSGLSASATQPSKNKERQTPPQSPPCYPHKRGEKVDL